MRRPARRMRDYPLLAQRKSARPPALRMQAPAWPRRPARPRATPADRPQARACRTQTRWRRTAAATAWRPRARTRATSGSRANAPVRNHPRCATMSRAAGPPAQFRPRRATLSRVRPCVSAGGLNARPRVRLVPYRARRPQQQARRSARLPQSARASGNPPASRASRRWRQAQWPARSWHRQSARACGRRACAAPPYRWLHAACRTPSESARHCVSNDANKWNNMGWPVTPEPMLAAGCRPWKQACELRASVVPMAGGHHRYSGQNSLPNGAMSPHRGTKRPEMRLWMPQNERASRGSESFGWPGQTLAGCQLAKV